MKKSSMNMAPKGRIPAIRILEEASKYSVTRRAKNFQQTSKHSPHKLVHVPALLWNLPGDLVGAHRIIIRLLPEAKIVAQVDQRQGDPEPHAEQSQHGGERNLGLDPHTAEINVDAARSSSTTSSSSSSAPFLRRKERMKGPHTSR